MGSFRNGMRLFVARTFESSPTLWVGMWKRFGDTGFHWQRRGVLAVFSIMFGCGQGELDDGLLPTIENIASHELVASNEGKRLLSVLAAEKERADSLCASFRPPIVVREHKLHWNEVPDLVMSRLCDESGRVLMSVTVEACVSQPSPKSMVVWSEYSHGLFINFLDIDAARRSPRTDVESDERALASSLEMIAVDAAAVWGRLRIPLTRGRGKWPLETTQRMREAVNGAQLLTFCWNVLQSQPSSPKLDFICIDFHDSTVSVVPQQWWNDRFLDLDFERPVLAVRDPFTRQIIGAGSPLRPFVLDATGSEFVGWIVGSKRLW